MLFSEVLETIQPADGGWTARVGEDWLQGRTMFGGLQAALAVRAMRALVPAELPLRTLQTTFIAPIGQGELRLEARVLRTGKSAVHVEARILDGEQTACFVLGIFGASRSSTIVIEPPPPVIDVSPEQARELPFLPGITPAFTKHLRFRWATGGFPYSGAKLARTQIYVGVRGETAIGEAQVIALADSIPSPGLSLLKAPAAASSLTWTLEFLTGRLDFPASDDWLMDAEVTAGSDGYLSQSATLWSPERKAVALSRQSVVAFA